MRASMDWASLSNSAMSFAAHHARFLHDEHLAAHRCLLLRADQQLRDCHGLRKALLLQLLHRAGRRCHGDDTAPRFVQAALQILEQTRFADTRRAGNVEYQITGGERSKHRRLLLRAKLIGDDKLTATPQKPHACQCLR